jgi:hypothetical protein
MTKKSSPVSLTAHAEFVDSISDVSDRTSPGLAQRELVITFNKCDYGRTSSVNIDFVGSPARCPIKFTDLHPQLTDISIYGRKPRGRKLEKLRSSVERLLKEPELQKAYTTVHHGHYAAITIVLPPLPAK